MWAITNTRLTYLVVFSLKNHNDALVGSFEENFLWNLIPLAEGLFIRSFNIAFLNMGSIIVNIKGLLGNDPSQKHLYQKILALCIRLGRGSKCVLGKSHLSKALNECFGLGLWLWLSWLSNHFEVRIQSSAFFVINVFSVNYWRDENGTILKTFRHICFRSNGLTQAWGILEIILDPRSLFEWDPNRCFNGTRYAIYQKNRAFRF